MVENISSIVTKVKAKIGTLGELGLDLEKEIRALSEISTFESHFVALSKKYNFVMLVDDLDLGWDNSEQANNIILGLLNAANYIHSKSNNCFVCIFLREDIYSAIIKTTTHSDKFRLTERIRWEKDELMELLSSRINFNRINNGLDPIYGAYSTVFPSTVGTTNVDNWLTERTLNRPRELIQLARLYTENCKGSVPESDALKEVEKLYSE